MAKASSLSSHRLGPKQLPLAEVERLLMDMLGEPPQSARDLQLRLSLARKEFTLLISLVTRDRRTALTLDEVEMLLDLLMERGVRVAAPAPLRVKEARSLISLAALQLGEDPNAFWLGLVERLLQEYRHLVQEIARLAEEENIAERGREMPDGCVRPVGRSTV